MPGYHCFDLLRRNEEESLLHRAEAIMLELTHVLQKIDSLRNDMQETQKKLQEELDGNHTKLDALKQRRVGHELALAGAKKNQAQLLKMKKENQGGEHKERASLEEGVQERGQQGEEQISRCVCSLGLYLWVGQE